MHEKSAPPDRCRRCHAVDLIIDASKQERINCRAQHQMTDACGYFVAIPGGRAAVVATAVAEHSCSDQQQGA